MTIRVHAPVQACHCMFVSGTVRILIRIQKINNHININVHREEALFWDINPWERESAVYKFIEH
jgi:hypothetical protein